MKKLENLISFDDFKSNWKPEQNKSSKRTSTGVDILKENVEEIIPEGPEGSPDVPDYDTGKSYDEKVSEINDFLDDEPDENVLEEVVNVLRDGLTEMEQMGFVESDVIDDLDDEHDGDWVSWCKDVIQLPDFFEEGLDNVLELINNTETLEFGQIGQEDEEEEQEGWGEEYGDEVECPDCDGTGVGDDGNACERCDGVGHVDRPYDIPPDR